MLASFLYRRGHFSIIYSRGFIDYKRLGGYLSLYKITRLLTGFYYQIKEDTLLKFLFHS
jgi:hypothetical protein